jgi:hypothetical protein
MRWLLLLMLSLTSCAHVSLISLAAPNDRPVALAFGSYGPLFVRFGDDTVGSLRSWSNGRQELRWRSNWRVKDLVADTNRVCVLTVDDDAFCVDGESGRRGEVIHEPGARDVGLGLNKELCVVKADGLVRCNAGTLFAKFPPLTRLIDFTACGIDEQARLLCRGDQLKGNYWEDVVTPMIDGVADAQLVPNGPAVTGCALLTSGEVSCFGTNRFGEQGTGKRSGSEGLHRVEGLPKIRRLAHRTGVTCAIDVDGGTWCFGAWFGPDYERAAKAVPTCQRVTSKVVIPPCPPSGANGDNPCMRMGGSYSERVVDRVDVVRDPEGQCADGQAEAYVPKPTRITLFSRGRDVVLRNEGAMFLTEEGVIVTTFYGRWTEALVAPRPQ